jgi:succinate-acetate transporter protein
MLKIYGSARETSTFQAADCLLKPGKNMAKTTMLFGALLCGISLLVLFLQGEVASVSIFIPMFVGLPLLVLGALSEWLPGQRKHFMHGAVTLGLLGALAAMGRGVPQLVKLAQGEDVKTLPLASVWTMIFLCSTFVVLCVRSFIEARRAREAAGVSGASGNDKAAGQS